MHHELQAIKLVPSLMPKFSVYDPLSSNKVDLSFDGEEMILLNIWATWCPPCQKEMPSLALLQEKLRGKLRIIALSVDDDVSAVTDFIKANNPSFTVLWDKDKASLKHFGVEKYPETFLISPDGYLTTQFSGPRDWGSALVLDYFSNIFP